MMLSYKEEKQIFFKKFLDFCWELTFYLCFTNYIAAHIYEAHN